MRISFLIISVLFLFSETAMTQKKVIKLPEPDLKGKITLATALLKRRSVRSFSDKSLSQKQVSQILWAAQGITNSRGFRTAPSAGALYPIEIYFTSGNVDGLDKGFYHYNPEKNSVKMVSGKDFKSDVFQAGLYQEPIEEAAINILIAAIYKRTTAKYGDRGHQYAMIEVGHVAQNIHLQCVALGLGSVPIGAFYEGDIQDKLPIEGEVLYIIPIGYPR